MRLPKIDAPLTSDILKDRGWVNKKSPKNWEKEKMLGNLQLPPAHRQKFGVKQTKLYWKNIGTIETFGKKKFQMRYHMMGFNHS